MKNLFVIISAATVLAMTATAMHASSRGDYDVRPENKVPRMERPAWPDYDLHNQNSFAVFADVQTAPENEGVRLRWESERVSSGRITLCRCREATYVTFDWTVPSYQDWWFFRWTEGAMMIDADTGDRYMLRRLEHFPMNQCFWIHGQSGETIRIVSVYPPLPLSVKRIRFFDPDVESRQWMSGRGKRSLIYDVESLRPSEAPQPRGRVIY